MKHLWLVFFLLFLTMHLSCQNLEERVQILEKENEQLRKKLEDCQSSPFIKLADHLENEKLGENSTHSREELHTILLEDISKKSTESAAVAKAVIKKTDDLLNYCELVKDNLIQRTGGIDPIRNRPKGCLDKNIGTELLIVEKKGGELKEKITILRDEILKIVGESPTYSNRITLKIDPFPKEKYNSWEEYKFTKMPLCAILPMIANIKAQAKESEIATLEYLKE